MGQNMNLRFAFSNSASLCSSLLDPPRLPFALSLLLLRQFSLFLSSPLFVFFLSNAIIATLVAKSGPPPAPAPLPMPTPKFTTSSSKTRAPIKLTPVAIKDTDSKAGLDSDFAKVYRRTQSEKLKEECPERTQQKLRRSETEKKHMENGRESMYPQDNLSNEEFQRTIEAFIAKQMRFLREESLAIVIQNQS
ncbi:uncharacterized protein LOC114719070 [Neltuma alba]|uniref:uncharacterized protein LOC114719070 n=1 Tax=Neltuma alba TaxID=207710 RepID=UPI0010A3EFE1|nr:uncharacterized protein LOC114719070 [Prosopis alba]